MTADSTATLTRAEAIERLKRYELDIEYDWPTTIESPTGRYLKYEDVIKALENSSPDDSAETATKDKIGYEVFRLLNIPNEDWDDVISEQWALLGRITGNADDEQGLVRIGAEWGKRAEAHSERDSAQEERRDSKQAGSESR